MAPGAGAPLGDWNPQGPSLKLLINTYGNILEFCSLKSVENKL